MYYLDIPIVLCYNTYQILRFFRFFLKSFRIFFMRKLIQIIFVTGLFLMMTLKVDAASVAGESAALALFSRLDQREVEAVSDFKKRLAIKAVLERYDSPMVDEIDSFMDACRKYSLDCYLLPSIAGIESTFGRFTYPGSNNAFGWGRGLIPFKNWGEGIDTVGRGLRENYMNKWGAQTVEEIGAIYCEGNTWAGKVTFFMKQFQNEEAKLSLYEENFPVQL